jgi:hypothetical protein
MAQVLAKVARREDEAEWLGLALSRSVREMRLIAMRAAEASDGPSPPLDLVSADTDDERATLTITVDRMDAILFEYARMIVRRLGGVTLEDTLEALLGEGATALLEDIPKDAFAAVDDLSGDLTHRRWVGELARWREEAEGRCERLLLERAKQPDRRVCEEGEKSPGESLPDFAGDAASIDVALRGLANELATRDLEVGRLAEAFWKADGWRRLGYATESQYARERLGASLSSVKAKRALARRAAVVPRLATAIAERELGYEAARLVATVATAETADQWIVRARARTVKLLREEVDATAMLHRLDAERHPLPPSDAVMGELAQIEGQIVGGAAFLENAAGSVGLSGDHETSAGTGRPGFGQISAPGLAALLGGFSRSGAHVSAGRVTLKMRVSMGLRRFYRAVEQVFQRHRPKRASFLRFLCDSLIDTWRRVLGTKGAYSRIYERDRFRCSSPVCSRRDLTPHHLKFRSAGGDDSDENVTALCTWCHLEGVHGGRLRAEPPASCISWTIGRHTVVRGRERVQFQT